MGALPTNTDWKPMRILSTAASAVFMVLLLLWQHLHGGVPAHHVLARADMPAISNWWGLLVLPALTWVLAGRIERRRRHAPESVRSSLPPFVAALLFGAVLAWCVDAGHGGICDYMVMALAPLAMFYPLHRAECILGFVVGMSLFIGAILPTVAGLVFAAIGAVLFHGVRLLWLMVAARVR
jgi:hypothetical protein